MNIEKCTNCPLYKNQKPLLDTFKKSYVMWVGLSAKKVNNVLLSKPLDENTNSGSIIKKIENSLSNYTFYKTNLVKCLPLNEKGKLRYPTKDEMDACIENLLNEIDYIKPKIIFLLGHKVHDYITKYLKVNNINYSGIKIYYIEHPSYIYVYKRKNIDDYINKIVKIVRSN